MNHSNDGKYAFPAITAAIGLSLIMWVLLYMSMMWIKTHIDIAADMGGALNSVLDWLSL